jgi:hypothetical protein
LPVTRASNPAAVSGCVNSHLKMIFGKVGVSRRQELAAALTGRTPPSAHVAP